MRSPSDPFAVAQAQFDAAAAFLGLDQDLAEFLRWPRREFVFTVPVRMDDGRTRTVQGYRVQYNNARGPCSGGLRWHADGTPLAGRAMAAGMTWRTALMDLPLGGAAGGLMCDSKKFSETEKERAVRGWMRAMARELGPQRDIITPDIYTTPQIMAWLRDEYEAITGQSCPAVVTGQPVALGGSLGRDDATARGGVLAVREACRVVAEVDPQGAYAIQGFGNAGQNAALLHPEILGGGRLIAVADTSGAIYNKNGLDPQAVVTYKRKTGQVAGFPGVEPIGAEDLLELKVEVLYPVALEGVITGNNADQINAKIICELADGAITPEAETILHVKGVHVIPDFLANAGGVTASYFEQVHGGDDHGCTRAEMHRLLDAKMTRAYQDVYEMHKNRNVPMRLAAGLLAVSRVAEAVRLRGWV